MSLSKTAKRFLSSTMAIALAGGSVLAFGNSALADPPGTPGSGDATVSFSETVSPECAIVTASDKTDYDRSNNSLPIVDIGQGANEDRTAVLTATDSIVFDCNTAKVQVVISGTGTTYTAPTGTNATASNLTASHVFQYGLNVAADTTVADGDLGTNIDTDGDGDLTINVSSVWTAQDEELLAQTYGATTTFTVTAQQERYISSNSLD